MEPTIHNIRSAGHKVLVALPISAGLLGAGLFIGVTAATAQSGALAAATAAHQSAAHRANHASHGAVVYGGTTSANAPVVIQVSPNGREVAKATMAVPVHCQAPGQAASPTIYMPDVYTHIPINSARAFHDNLETPPLSIEGNGSLVITSRLSGKFNGSLTAVKGTWSLHLIEKNATGAVTNECDSGAVSFTANL
jgi:hypothetical protein